MIKKNAGPIKNRYYKKNEKSKKIGRKNDEWNKDRNGEERIKSTD